MRLVANFIRELLNSQVIPQMHYDSTRLVDAWVIDAKNWLRYASDVPALTPLEAFEGIEHLGRLTRISPALLTESGGESVLHKIRDIYLGKHKEMLLDRALTAPEIDAWIPQAEKLDRMILTTWESTFELGCVLLEDMDAFDLMMWWAEESSIITPVQSEWNGHDLRRIQNHINDCAAWLAIHAECFLECEAQVRAIADAIRDDIETADSTSLLVLSSGKYIALLVAFERIAVQERLSGKHPVPVPTVLDKEFWRSGIPREALMAASTDDVPTATDDARRSAVPVTHPVFTDTSRRFQATLHLPRLLKTNGRTSFNVTFQSPGKNEDLNELLGVLVSLGGSQSPIEIKSGGTDAAYGLAELVAEDVTQANEDLALSVAGVPWLLMMENQP